MRTTYVQIKAAVLEVTGLTMADLTARSRKKRLVTARTVCYLLAKQRTPLSYTRIGELTGGFDHATVMHGKKKAERQLDKDPKFAALFAAVEAALDQSLTTDLPEVA